MSCCILSILFYRSPDIRIGMDLSQYMFYITAHRYVAAGKSVQVCSSGTIHLYERTYIFFLSCIFPDCEMEPFSFSCSCMQQCAPVILCNCFLKNCPTFYDKGKKYLHGMIWCENCIFLWRDLAPIPLKGVNSATIKPPLGGWGK